MARGLLKLIPCEKGHAFMIATALMPLLVGASAIAIDIGQWALARRQLQRTADTAALAGATAVYNLRPAHPAAQRTFDHNNQNSFAPAAVIENAPTAGPYAGDTQAVRVIVSTTPRLSFVSYFGVPTTISAEATAKAIPDPRYCLVTLEDGMTEGFDFSGSTGVTADCGIMTNSRKRPSTITFGGSAARVEAPEVGAVGLIANASNWVAGTKLMPYQSKLPDPFASVPEASTFIPSSCSSALVVEGGQWNNRTLSPGCWSGLSIKRDIVLNSGTYVVNGGTLEFAANANVTANGPVTFILTGPNSSSIAKLVITSTALINLSAPTSGTLKDVLFYQDRRARYLGSENTMVGTATSTFNGSLYFPSSNLSFTGNSSSTGICMKIVALRMTFTGNSSANLTCPTSARGGMFGHTVRLVA